MVWLVLFLALLLSPSLADAACSGSSPTRTAANATQTEVNACLTVAVSGDTIVVPAGSAIWSFLLINKEVTLQGNGIGNTVISCNGGTRCFDISTVVTVRVTGFTFSWAGVVDGSFAFVGKGTRQPTGKSVRLDHNAFTSASRWIDVEVWGAFDSGGANAFIARLPTVLVDHNTFTNASTKVFGTDAVSSDDQLKTQNNCWTQSWPLGTGTEALFVEDNTFTADAAPTANFSDMNQCGRVVWRFNTATHTGGRQILEVHSIQGTNRASHRWEIYKNNISTNGFTNFFMRSGTGVIWGNRSTTVPNGNPDTVWSNIRSQNAPPSFGGCDGTATWVDQNTTPDVLNVSGYGYRCRDQIGSGSDTVQWVIPSVTQTAYAQTAMPAYVFDNKSGATIPTASTNYFTTVHTAIDGGFPSLTVCGTSPCIGNAVLHIKSDRDYYIEGASFTGSSGVGVGTLAARPTTCTTGVGYWVTNQGEWNSLQVGPDGQLYKCTATDTWTLYYTPFTYPHPLQGAAGSNPPAAPTGVMVSSIR